LFAGETISNIIRINAKYSGSVLVKTADFEEKLKNG
jgi:hypothetical protein